MRLYIKYEYDFEYPDDMKTIMGYLVTHGILVVGAQAIERLYREYCEDSWCAGWMIVDENILENFSDWLEEKNI